MFEPIYKIIAKYVRTFNALLQPCHSTHYLRVATKSFDPWNDFKPKVKSEEGLNFYIQLEAKLEHIGWWQMLTNFNKWWETSWGWAGPSSAQTGTGTLFIPDLLH